MWFPQWLTVNRVASTIYADGDYVTALCHGPEALLDVTGKDGKKVAGKAVGLADVVPYLLQDELTALGAS